MAGSYYLMSACQTADEFVAAFRRYAEKTMLFVPTATPLPQGTRARLAITLADGSVMIEGDAEVVGSTARAVGLHARAGMSVRFIELDDTSRQVIDQLVRARLMSRPVPLPTHLRARPRAGTVPEPSPELQAEQRARATSTVHGMAPIANVNAEALPAECTLVEVPAEAGDVAARFDYSAPAPRDVELPGEPPAAPPIAGAKTPVIPRPMTMKGPGPGRMPGLATPALGVGALARAGIAEPVMTPAEPPYEPRPSGALAAVADPSTEISIEEISAESFEHAEPDVSKIDTNGPTEPLPPKLPSTVRGRQSMSKTMMGVAPIVMKPPAPGHAPGPGAGVAETPAPATTPAPPGEVFGAWWPDGVAQTDHSDTVPMEPLFKLPPEAGDAGDDEPADDAAEATEPARPRARPPAPNAIGPWTAADPARLPPPPHEMTPLAHDAARDPSGDLAHAPTAPSAPPGLAPAYQVATFAQPFPDAGPPPVFEENTDLVSKKRRPNRVMIASFGGAILLAVIVVVIATGGGKKPDASAAVGSGTASEAIDAQAAAVVSDAATAPVALASIDAGAGSAGSIAPPTPPSPPISTGACKATFTSTPSGADLVIAGKPAGMTPTTIALACGAATATFKRARYQPKEVAFTPTRDGAAVAAKLERPQFIVKITSTPAGATVSIAGKVVGKTPLSTKAAGFESATVSFKKDGYAPANAKLYAKANGSVVAVKLKKGAAPKAAPHHR